MFEIVNCILNIFYVKQLTLDSLVSGFSGTGSYLNPLPLFDEEYRTRVTHSLKVYWAIKYGQRGEIERDSLVFYNCYLATRICELQGETEKAEKYARRALQLYENSDHFYIIRYVKNCVLF